jgi:hypothetical protein
MAIKDNGMIDICSIEETKIVDQYKNWDQKIVLGLNKTDIGIKIEVWDNNRYGKDEFLGFCFIPIESIITDELSSRVLDTNENNTTFHKDSKKIMGTNGSNQIFKKGRKKTNRIVSQISSERKVIYQIKTIQSGRVHPNLMENIPKNIALQTIKMVHSDPNLKSTEDQNYVFIDSSFDLLKGEVLRDSSDDVQLLEKTASIDTNDSENYHGKWLRSKGKLYITNFRFVYISKNTDRSPKTIMVRKIFCHFLILSLSFFYFSNFFSPSVLLCVLIFYKKN